MFSWNKPQPQIVIARQAVRPPNTSAAPVVGPDEFEPCFVRDIVDGDTIAIEHPVKPGLTEMTVSRMFRSDYTLRTEGREAQWIGTLTNGQQVHCSYEQPTPVWRMPRPQEVTDEESEAFWSTGPDLPAFTQA